MKMNPRQHLEALATEIEREILETGTILFNGTEVFKNNSSNNPYSGLCHGAVWKLKELAPDLEMNYVAFEISNGKNQLSKDVHAVAKVLTENGNFIVDPTIQQYLPNAKMVYAANEEYPLIAIQGTMTEMPLQNYP